MVECKKGYRMIKQNRVQRLSLKHETIRLLSQRQAVQAIGGSAGSSDPSNTVSGDDCSGGPGSDNSLAGNGCEKTQVVRGRI